MSIASSGRTRSRIVPRTSRTASTASRPAVSGAADLLPTLRTGTVLGVECGTIEVATPE